MIPDGTYTAVLDRIEDGLAALEISTDDERYELLVAPEELPPEGRHADAVLSVCIEDETVTAATYDPEETERRGEAAQDRFDRLSRRPPDSESDTPE